MTTCVVVKKDGEVAIAADSLVTFGDTRLARGYEQNQKIFQVGESLIALAGTTAHFPVMRSLLAGLADECRLGSRDDVFRTFLKVHEKLKDEYFVNTKEDDDDPYESSQITCLIANPTGIYGVYSYREVFAFDRFWASARGAISRWGDVGGVRPAGPDGGRHRAGRRGGGRGVRQEFRRPDRGAHGAPSGWIAPAAAARAGRR